MTPRTEVELAGFISAIIDPLFKVSSFCWQECTPPGTMLQDLGLPHWPRGFQQPIRRAASGAEKQVLREWNKVIAYWGLD